MHSPSYPTGLLEVNRTRMVVLAPENSERNGEEAASNRTVLKEVAAASIGERLDLTFPICISGPPPHILMM